MAIRPARSAPGYCRIQRSDIDLFHAHHRIERALGFVSVRARRQLEQPPRRDLPRKPPAVFAPAAGTLHAAAPHDRVPIAVGLLLTFGDDHEADRLVRLEVGPAIEPDEAFPEYRKLDRQLDAYLTAGKITRGAVHPADMAIGKGLRVKLRRFLGFAVVKPDTGHELGHRCLLKFGGLFGC